MSSLNSKKLLARIVEKWPVKVLSVAAAFILFVFHRVSILESRFFSAPLQLELSAELVPVSPYPRLVRISVRGDADSIFPIVEDDIEAYIDLTKQSAEGWYRSPVQIRKKGTALGVEPLEISVDPLEISIQLDKKIRKTIPLNVNTQGNVESGFELLSYSLTPHQVTIEGPLSIVDSVSELSTDIVDLEGRNESFSVTVHILNPDSLVVIRGNGTTEFQALILPAVPTININGIPIEMKELASHFETEPVVGSVRLEGARELLDSFVPLPDFLSVDCSALNEPGTYTLPVLINVPEGLSVAYREPEELSLTVTLRETTPGESLPE